MQIHEFYPNFISLISIPSAASSRGYRNRQLQGRRGSSERKFDSCAILSVVVPSNRMQSARARGHWNRKPSMRPSRWPAWRQPPPACLRLTDTTHIGRCTRCCRPDHDHALPDVATHGTVRTVPDGRKHAKSCNSHRTVTGGATQCAVLHKHREALRSACGICRRGAQCTLVSAFNDLLVS